jgi:5-methylcytosine-specific restriction enzyme A
MATLEEIRPKSLRRIMDCAEEAGIDVSDWKRAANPSRCYAWSFVQPDKQIVVLNLWMDNMRNKDGAWAQQHNSRKSAEKMTGPRKTRARRMDQDVRYAFKHGLPVKVILLDRKKQTDDRAAKRGLDNVCWAVTNYNQKTGDWTTVREAKPVRFVDQHSIDDADTGEPKRRMVTGSAFARDREIRDQALARAVGFCEYCGEPGFEMANGNIYLETHHIVPLSEGGKDIAANVASLCANHHRQAHHGKSRLDMRGELLKRVSARN